MDKWFYGAAAALASERLVQVGSARAIGDMQGFLAAAWGFGLVGLALVAWSALRAMGEAYQTSRQGSF